MRESFYAHCIRTGKQRLLSQWLREENLPLTPAELSYGSRKKVWWQCERGHRWQAAVYARAGRQRSGCPVCAGTVRRRRVPGSLTNDQIAGHRV